MINNEIIISKSISLVQALEIMNRVDRKLLVVCDNMKFLGVISIGDVQRALLNKQDLSLPVIQFVRTKITFAYTDDDIERIKSKMRKEKIEAMPIVDNDGILQDIIEWDQLFVDSSLTKRKRIELPIVIMAGGKGTRLLPLTNVIPKPLIPISDKTIIEEIMSRFRETGCHKFYLSVNYLTNTIKSYFINKSEWDICYIQEDKPLGTGGSLYLLKEQIKETFVVTNCDTLIDIDLNDLLAYHRDNKNLVTIVSAIKTVHIPYGTIETGKDGIIKEIKEKPDFVYQVNSGLYVFEPEIFQYIENNKFMNITDLIAIVIRNHQRVGAFPVPEKSWVDMGNWDEYLKLVSKYNSDHK